MPFSSNHAARGADTTRKASKHFKYLRYAVVGIILACLIGTLISSACAAAFADGSDGDGDGDDDDDHHTSVRSISIAAAVWSGLSLLQQAHDAFSNSGGDGPSKPGGPNAPRRDDPIHPAAGAAAVAAGMSGATYGRWGGRVRKVMWAVQAALLIWGIVVLALWCNPLVARKYQGSRFEAALWAWGIMGWIAWGLKTLAFIFEAIYAATRRRKSTAGFSDKPTHGAAV